MLEVEREVQAEILQARGNDLRAMTDLYLAVTGMLTADKWTVGKRGNSRPVLELMMGLLTKSLKTFRSIQILCACGRIDDAKVLLRVLTETYILVKFVLQKQRTERTRVYHAWATYQDLKMMRGTKATKGLKRGIPKTLITKYERRLASITSGLAPSVRYDRQWSGLGTIYDSFKAVNSLKLYSSVYRMTSASAHGSDIGAHQEFDKALDGPENQFLPSIKGFDATAMPAREVFWHIAYEINRKIGLGFDAVLTPHRLTKSVLAGPRS